MNPLAEKRLNIFYNALVCCNRIIELSKQLPKGKRKNIFHKHYNRRPMVRLKSARVISLMQIELLSSALQMRIIQSQPIPKYKPGSSRTGVINGMAKEIINRN